MSRFLYFVSALSLLLIPGVSNAQNDTPIPVRKPLEGRVDVNTRLGNDRSLLMTEFWVPIAQNAVDGSVIYGDLRLMGDDQDNREFNVGVGYREIIETALLGEGIVGGHVWYDRRLTESGSTFNQVTGGLEWFDEIWEAKINAYVPLNDGETFSRLNPLGTGIGFTGTQITVNTDQTLIEEALPGFDIELGLKVPILEDYTDSTRFYAGAYHFEGDRAEDVSGWRARIRTDVTSDIAFGARFERDDVRGSQGFLEATIRFPFGSKQSYKSQGLYARLDESPERDIDVIAVNVVADDGLAKPLISSTTGEVQNVIHVDNTAAGGGDGSNEARFSTLTAAQAAAGPNDIIYVHRGTGGTAGMNAGILLDDAGQKLIGAGINLTAQDLGLTLPTGSSNITTSTMLIAADPLGAPTITNAAGDGITISANNVRVSGVTVDGASDDGFVVASDNATVSNVVVRNTTDDGFDIDDANDLELSNVTVTNAGINAIDVLYDDNRTHSLSWNNITMSGNNAGSQLNFSVANATNMTFAVDTITSNDSASNPIRMESSNTALFTTTIQNASATNTNGSAGNGIAYSLNDSSRMNVTLTDSVFDVQGTGSNAGSIQLNDSAILTALISGNTFRNGLGDNLRIDARDTSNVLSATVQRNTIANTTNFHGILVRARNDSTVSNVLIDDNNVMNSNNTGIVVDDFGATTSTRSNITISNNTVTNSATGISLSATNSTGNITNALIDGNTVTTATGSGIVLNATTASMAVSVQNNSVSNTTDNNISINDDFAGGAITVDLGGGALGSVGNNSFFNKGNFLIFADLDGAELKAENNWWDNAAGLQAGDRSLDAGSGGTTIDADPFLTSAP